MCYLNLHCYLLGLLTQNLLVAKDTASQPIRASPAKNNFSVLHAVSAVVERALNNQNNLFLLLKIPQQKANMVEFWFIYCQNCASTVRA